jgi:hypothetical protein
MNKPFNHKSHMATCACVAFYALLMLGGCGDSTDSKSSVLVFTDPRDSTIASISGADGSAVTLWGLKDTRTGFPIQPTDVVIQSPGEPVEESLSARLDGRARPTSLASRSLGRLEFTYVNETRLVVGYTTPDGTQSVQFPLDTSVGGQSVRRLAPQTQRIRKRIEAQGAPRFLEDSQQRGHIAKAPEGTRFTQADQHSMSNQNTAEGRTGRVLVSCDAAGNNLIPGASVELWRVYAPAGATLPPRSVPQSVKETAPGTFAYFVPAPHFEPVIDEDSVVGQLSKFVEDICVGSQAVEKMEKDIAAEIFRLLKIPVQTVATYLSRFARVCNYNEWLSKIGELQIPEFADKFTVSASHPTLLHIDSAHYEVPVSGAIPSRTLAFENSSRFNTANRLTSVTVDPIDPFPGQAYQFTTQAVCASAGSQLTLSIIGTDGYRDSLTYPVSTSSGIVYSLWVEGAEQGVTDEVTARLTTSTGQLVGSELKKIVVF